METMINLLTEDRWDFAAPWGNVVNPDTDKEIVMQRELIKFLPDRVEFSVKNRLTLGWKMDKAWQPVHASANWAIGHMISKDTARTHYGYYTFTFVLPKFRGSWPAIWFVDMRHESIGGMGMPPELDVFEHFRKDRFGTRFHTTHTLHHGKTYEQAVREIAVYRKLWLGLWPIDTKPMTVDLHWLPSGMRWVVNGQVIMEVPATVSNYPTKPMNLLMGAGIGLDWKPQVSRFSPFIVTRAEYQQL